MASFRKTVSWLLFPLTVWYGVVVWVRNVLFDIGLLRQRSCKATTIAVGNLACGGTGKTPHVEYLLRLLANDYRTALVSRGYLRHSKGLVVNDGSNDAALLGDEPAMIASKFPNVTVAVSEKRAVAIDYLESQPEPAQLIILDDAYQHRYVKPHLNILLTDYNHLYSKDHVLPFGDLREFRSGRRRANIIIVTKCPEKLGSIERRDVLHSLKKYPYQKVFFSSVRYGDLVSLTKGQQAKLSDYSHVLLVAGIANPTPMLRYLRKSCKVTPMFFPDHHNFTSADIERIVSKYNSLTGARRVIVTTEKDAARLSGQTALEQLPVFALPIEVVVTSKENYDFDDTIRSVVAENSHFQVCL